MPTKENRIHRDTESYSRYKNSVQSRAEIRNPEFVKIWERIQTKTVDELVANSRPIHQKCYRRTTNKHHLKRDRQKVSKPTKPDIKNLNDVGHFTRSKQGLCFFCEKSTDEELHTSRESGTDSIKAIVNKSDRTDWKHRMSVLDAQGDHNGIMYHSWCKLYYYKEYITPIYNAPDIEEETNLNLQQIMAEAEFIESVQDLLAAGETLTSVDIENMYKEKMKDYSLEITLSRDRILKMLQYEFDDVNVFSHRGRMPRVISSTKTARNAIDVLREQCQSLVSTAAIVRKAISKAKFKVCNDSLFKMAESDVPCELFTLVRLILAGPEQPKTEARRLQMKEMCMRSCQTILASHLTERQVRYEPTSADHGDFRHRFTSPNQIGISLWLYYNLRSQKVNDFMFKAGFGINYSSITLICAKIATAVKTNAIEHGVFVPYGLQKGTLRCSSDNIDKRIYNLTGKDSFHGLASTLYQRLYADDSPIEYSELLTVPVGGIALKATPKTCIELVAAPRRKPSSPVYDTFESGKFEYVYSSSCVDDTMWLSARYFARQGQFTCMLI